MRAMTPAEKNALAQSAMPELEKIVGANHRRFGRHLEREEIYSAALNGLAHAIERYDLSSSVSIGVFARARMQGEIFDRMSSMSRLPRRVLRQVAAFRIADEQARADEALPPPDSRVEAAHRLADRLQELATIYVSVGSFHGDFADSEGMAPDARLEQEQYFQQVHRALNRLPEHHRNLILKVFFKELSLREISQEEGRSASWVTKKLQGALGALRQQFREMKIEAGG
jgi:RNA polymerase sigma factor (sigma-70 family)